MREGGNILGIVKERGKIGKGEYMWDIRGMEEKKKEGIRREGEERIKSSRETGNMGEEERKDRCGRRVREVYWLPTSLGDWTNS